MIDDPGRPLRIRLVSPGFPPARGGVEEHCHQIATRLAAGGDRVAVLTATRTGPTGSSRRADGVGIHTYRAWPTTSMSISPGLTLAGLTRGTRHADVTHVHSYHASSGFAALAGRRAPVVFTPHYHGAGHSPLARALHVGYQVAGRAMFASADAIICVSHAERQAVERDFPGTAERIRVVPNGVDRAAIRAATAFEDQPPTVLVVGRLETYKNVDVVLRAVAAGASDTQLVVIGAGSQGALLRTLADELGVSSRVRFLEGVDEVELHRWMRTASVLVSLSDHEAFGMVPLEAATAGARTVLSDIPAHREIAATWLGGSAELVSADDAESVRDAVGRALAAEGRIAVDVPDWNDVAAATRAVYREVIENRTPDARPADTRERSVTRTTRFDLLDAPWAEHSSGALITPVAMPSLDELRDTWNRLALAHPDAALVGRMNARGWQPVAPDDREAFTDTTIVPIDDPAPEDADAFMAASLHLLQEGRPIVIGVGRSSLLVLSTHQLADGATFTLLMRALLDADMEALGALTRRAGLSDVVTAVRANARPHGREWWSFARRRAAGAVSAGAGAATTDPPEPVAAAGGAGAPRTQIVSVRWTPADLQLVSRWRSRNAKGTSITSVLTAATHQALADAGIPMSRTGFHTLVNLRRYLPDAGEGAFLPGNMAKSVRIEVDPSDIRAVGEASREMVDTARPVLSTLIGGLMSAIPRRAREHAGDGPVEMTFNSMPDMPGLSDLPWLDDSIRQYIGIGFPASAGSLTVLVLIMRTHTQVTVVYPESMLDAQAMRDALQSIPSRIAELATAVVPV